jgi:hypothetical protein
MTYLLVICDEGWQLYDTLDKLCWEKEILGKKKNKALDRQIAAAKKAFTLHKKNCEECRKEEKILLYEDSD